MDPLLLKTVYALLTIGLVMTLAAYAVLAERKFSARMQGRVGPNRTAIPGIHYIPIIGPLLVRLGIFQPLADGLKFFLKEEILPGHVNRFYYTLAPILAFVPALTTVVVIPFGEITDANGTTLLLILADFDLGLLFVVTVSSLGVYGIVLAGWASNSSYSFLGSIRASAQLISYELAMGLVILPVFMWASAPEVGQGLSLVSIVHSQKALWLCIWQPLTAFVFLVALFAETNRLPFDMAESETDLVGGFHTEYGSFKFGFFYIAEYAHVIIGSAVFTLSFLGGWYFLPGIPDPWPVGGIGALLSVMWFLIKVACVVFGFIWIRWTLPRFRYDQVMKLGWKVLLPLAFFNLILNAVLIALWEKL